MKINFKIITILLISIGALFFASYYIMNKSTKIKINYIDEEKVSNIIKLSNGNLLFGSNANNNGISQQYKDSLDTKWISTNDSSIIASIIKQKSLYDGVTRNTIDWYKLDESNKISENSSAYNLYSSFDDAVQFAAVTPYEEIPKFEGSKDKGGKYERYSITKLSDVLAQQSKEATKKATIQVACKGDGEDIMTFLLLSDKSTTDGKRYIDYITKPSIYLTQDEVYDCFQARDSQNLRDIHDMNNTRYPESLQIDKDSIETNYPIYQNLFKK